MLKLYGFWRSLASCRVRIALRLKGVPFEEIPINLMKGEQHADGYKAINPQAVVPALVVDDDAPLFQSMAILEYLEEAYPRPAAIAGGCARRVRACAASRRSSCRTRIRSWCPRRARVPREGASGSTSPRATDGSRTGR